MNNSPTEPESEILASDVSRLTARWRPVTLAAISAVVAGVWVATHHGGIRHASPKPSPSFGPLRVFPYAPGGYGYEAETGLTKFTFHFDVVNEAADPVEIRGAESDPKAGLTVTAVGPLVTIAGHATQTLHFVVTAARCGAVTDNRPFVVQARWVGEQGWQNLALQVPTQGDSWQADMLSIACGAPNGPPTGP